MANVTHLRAAGLAGRLLRFLDNSRLPFLFWWVLFNAAGGLLGEALLSALSKPSLDTSTGYEPPSIAPVYLLPGLVIWLVLAFYQWLVLWLYLPDTHMEQGAIWVSSSAIGGLAAVAVGYLLGTITFYYYGGILAFPYMQAGGVAQPQPYWLTLLLGVPFALVLGMGPGVVVGFAQGLFLQARYRLLKKWIAINMAAWALGSLALSVVTGLPVALYSIVSATDAGRSILYGGLVVTVSSLVSGLGLLRVVPGLRRGNRMSVALLFPCLFLSAILAGVVHDTLTASPVDTNVTLKH